MDIIRTWKGQISAIRGFIERNLNIEGWLRFESKNFKIEDHFVKSKKIKGIIKEGWGWN